MSKKEKRLASKKRKLEALVQVAALNDEDKNAGKKKKTTAEPTDEMPDSDHQNERGVESEVKDDIKRLQEEYRARRKLNMALPKLYLTVENIKRPLMQEGSGEEICEKWQPVLFCSDLQRLLLYCIQGNLASYKPRWCTLLRPGKVHHTVVIAVDDVGISEVDHYKDSFPYLHQNFDMSVEIACPMQYGRTTADELFNVLMGKERLIGWAATEESDTQRSEFSRLDLLLNPQQMAEENYPLPVSHGRCSKYVFSSEKNYQRVHEKSPIFSVDCEMCLSVKYKSVLTRVAVVDEELNVLYDTLVKPDIAIRDYLTKFSGITKKMLDPVTTTLKDVQNDLRKLIPPDAILCGQSLQSDLHALQMFHPYVIDTSVIFNLTGLRHKKTGLRSLTARFLGRDIQSDPSGHNPCEDAIATMELVNLKLTKGLHFGDVILGGPLVDMEESQKSESSPTEVPTHDGDVSKLYEEQKMDPESVESHDGDVSKLSQEASDSNESQTEVKSETSDSEDENKWSDGLKLVFFQRPHFVRNESLFSIAKRHKKSVVVVGREDDIKQYKDETETILAETDKIIAKRVINTYEMYDMIYCNLNGYSRCLDQNFGEDQIKEKLRKVDHRLKKMTKDLIPGTVIIIVFTGRVADSKIHNANVFLKSTLH